jgi:hypothetical protein
MSSIKQIIVNAIVKVSGENPALNREGEVSAVEARDDFIRLLMLELFPEDSAVVSVPLTEAAAVSPKKTKKTKKEVVPTESPAASPTKAAKAKKAKKEVAPAPVVAEPAPEPVKSPKEVKAEAKAAKAAKEAEKAAEKEAAKVAKAAAKAATPKKSPKKAAKAPEPEPEPVPAPVAESPKKSPKKAATKKVKPAEDANLQKIDPTWRKHLKKADKDGAKESEPLLLAYLNALSKEEFNAKKAEDHVTDFLAGRAAPAAAAVEDDGKVAAELTPVEFEGKDYYVNPETNRVYEGEGEYDEEVGWTNYKPVGYVGMAKFAEMKV